MSTQHARFQARLEESRPAVEAVAAWCRHKGRGVIVPPMHIASSADVAWLWGDRGDIIVDGKVIQVKGENLDFPPWPYEDVFISRKEQVDSLPDVAAYVLVNHDLTRAAVILPVTRQSWYVIARRASNTGNVEVVYACREDCVIWKRLTR